MYPAPVSTPPPEVLHQDARWRYLFKPAGLPVFSPHDGSGGPNLCSWLREQRPEAAAVEWPAGFAGGILHRLDNNTSGLVLAARSLEALEQGRALFATGALRKEYVFVSRGQVSWSRHVVDHALGHDRRRRARMVWRRGNSTPHRGRWYDAHTELRRLDGGRWRAVISTGVTHQIRVHAASVGLPLWGDRLYGGGEREGGFLLHHRTIEAGWPVDVPVVEPPEDWP